MLNDIYFLTIALIVLIIILIVVISIAWATKSKNNNDPPLSFKLESYIVPVTLVFSLNESALRNSFLTQLNSWLTILTLTLSQYPPDNSTFPELVTQSRMLFNAFRLLAFGQETLSKQIIKDFADSDYHDGIGNLLVDSANRNDITDDVIQIKKDWDILNANLMAFNSKYPYPTNPYSTLQQSFLYELYVLESTINYSKAYPGSPIPLSTVGFSGFNVYTLLNKLRNGSSSDKNMAQQFNSITQGTLSSLLYVTSMGSPSEDDITALDQNWDTYLQSFLKLYPVKLN